jgi:ribosomal protein S19E (S16A)
MLAYGKNLGTFRSTRLNPPGFPSLRKSNTIAERTLAPEQEDYYIRRIYSMLYKESYPPHKQNTERSNDGNSRKRRRQGGKEKNMTFDSS